MSTEQNYTMINNKSVFQAIKKSYHLEISLDDEFLTSSQSDLYHKKRNHKNISLHFLRLGFFFFTG